METKICKICNVEKPIASFSKDRKKKDGTYSHRNACKECKKPNHNRDAKKHREVNAEKYRESNSKSYQKHKEERKLKRREKYIKNREAELSRAKQYSTQNKDKIKTTKKTWIVNKKKNDPAFRMRDNMSKNIVKALKRHSSSKNGQSFLNFVPYTMERLKEHIEGQFEPWMTWGNWGQYNPKTWDDNDQSIWTWQIDHIIPHSTFQYTSMEDQAFRDCWALSNLRPLSAKQNYLDGCTKIRHNIKE